MDIRLKYGHGEKLLSFPERARVSVMQPSSMPAVPDLGSALAAALDRPLGQPPLEGRPRPRKVAIAVPDETRPAPVKALLPLLLHRLYRAWPGLAPEDVTIVVAAGLHPPLAEEDLRRIVPPSVAPGCRVASHDAWRAPMTDCGRTSRGTPVKVNALLGEADLKLLIGNIDPHQFVGFTGGAKASVIGCGARETIEANHALMFDERAHVGNIEGNPVRLDIDEAGERIGIDFVLNVIQDGAKQVVEVLAGAPARVCRAGARTCASLYGIPLVGRYDIVVASCGGYPKDITLYQAQKGLAHATQAVKPGGKLLLLAACPHGVGDEAYYRYVSRFSGPAEVLADFEAGGFRMGAHKAFLFSRSLLHAEVAVASDMPAETLASCHLRACDPQATLEEWIQGFAGAEGPAVAVITNANTSYFYARAS